MKFKIFTNIPRFFGRALCEQPEKETHNVDELPNAEEFERCILCGSLTTVPISMPVDWRENYEIGCGQLCAECAKNQRKTPERGNVLTNTQIMLAVEQSRKESKNQ